MMSVTLWLVVAIAILAIATGMFVFFRQRRTAGGTAGGGGGFNFPTVSPMAWRFLGAFTTFIVVNVVVAVLLPSIGRVVGAQGSEFLAGMEILLFVFVVLAWMGNHGHATVQWGLGVLFITLVVGVIISATSAHSNARTKEAVATRETPTVEIKTVATGERLFTALRLGDSVWFSNGCTRFSVRSRDGSWPEPVKIGHGSNDDVKFHPGEVREVMYAAATEDVWGNNPTESSCEVRITRTSN